ncbi:MAG TPA: hypothetical protein VL326_01720 [Kofleriaceae bacterium]|jgi:hypothetical protein|nr:hypothetical protein [Kofleriaceae bacterium]
MSPRFWLAAAMVTALAHPAFAGDAECNYMEIVATKSDKPALDPELKPLEKKFKKAPFSAWNNFKKLSSGAVSLTKNKPETQKLKQGSSSLMLRDRNEKRVELTVTMDDAAGKRVVEAKPAFKTGDWLMLGGPSGANDDGHILALTCK